MKPQFIMFKRSGVFYSENTLTGAQKSLRTKIKTEAVTLLNAKNESFRQPNLNLGLARTYLAQVDPEAASRNWQDVMNELQKRGKPQTQKRCVSAMQSSAYNAIRCLPLIQTKPIHLLNVANDPRVSVGHFLHRLHNLAFGLGWIPAAILSPKQWPELKFRTKRAITAEEHALILAAEKNGERNLYYRMVWETGASQSDAALLSAANINHQNRTLCYNRMKTGELAQVSIGEKLASLISQLPETGPFFPTISRTSDNARSAEFYRRCKILKIKGISLHSYRYAWAERARAAGYAKEQIRRKSLSRSVVANEKALKISSHLYDSGLTDFLHVLVSERSLYVSQDTQVQSDQSVSLNLVQLYKALGGGWQIPSK